jgi:hypothetical protein
MIRYYEPAWFSWPFFVLHIKGLSPNTLLWQYPEGYFILYVK